MWLKLTIVCFLIFNSITVNSERLPDLFTSLDPVVFDFSTQQQAFDITILQEFGESPSAELDILTDKTDIKQNIINNLDYLQGQGIKWILFSVLEGSGQLWFESSTLLSLKHSGFDYNSQYLNTTSDSELIVDESQAKKRFVFAYDILAFLLTQAHQRDIKVVANIEALAHIINHSTGQGIGAESDGACKFMDKNGDYFIGSWVPQSLGKSQFLFLKGTGKYQGITGKADDMLITMSDSAGKDSYRQGGKYHRCSRAKGSFQLPTPQKAAETAAKKQNIKK